MNTINNSVDSLCFCTAAYSKQYVRLAKLLATDLHEFAPNHLFVVFTDRPTDFHNHANVIAIKHWCRGVQPYHERRFAIQYALSIASTVMYLDADVRICDPIPDDLDFRPGLTARSCGNMKKHLQLRFNKSSLSSGDLRKKQIIEKMANKVGVDIYSPSVKFINEFLFVVKADEGREQEFLRLWGELAIYANNLGLYKHPTYAMALAAIKSGFPIYHSEMNGLNFFDDRIEKVRISKGESTLGARATQYFQAQVQIEQQNPSPAKRLGRFAHKHLHLWYNIARVRLTSLILPSLLLEYPNIKWNSLQKPASNSSLMLSK